VKPTICLWLCSSMLGLGRLFSLLIFSQSVGLLGRGMSPSQSRYLHIGYHKHKVNAQRHSLLEWDSNPRSQCLSGRRQFMPQTARPLWPASVWASEDSSCFRPRGHCDRLASERAKTVHALDRTATVIGGETDYGEKIRENTNSNKNKFDSDYWKQVCMPPVQL
jgi:hypothetical protein